MIDSGLAGRVALVTGANQGIGAATAYALAEEGAAVFVTYFRLAGGDDPSLPAEYDKVRARSADHVVDGIRAAGGDADGMEADLTDPAAPALLFDRAEAALGPVEILVNNASGWLADTFLPDRTDRFGRKLRPVDAASHGQQFAVDVRAPALLIAEFARRHVARGANWGRVIGLTSGSPYGFPEEVSYGAAKAAQENYTMSAARELGRYGITANIVHPPVTDTGWVTPEMARQLTKENPLRHIARPEDVAEVITFLASDQARFITAQLIRMT